MDEGLPTWHVHSARDCKHVTAVRVCQLCVLGKLCAQPDLLNTAYSL